MVKGKNEDVYQNVTDYLGRRSAHILSVIEKKPESNFQIDGFSNLKILKRGNISSVISLELKYLDKEIKEIYEKKVLIKYFGKDVDKRKGIRYKDFVESTANTCSFLSDNKDLKNFPFFYSHDKDSLGDFLILQQIGDETIHELGKYYDSDEIRYLIQSILPHISIFQINATKNLEKWVKNGKMTPEIYKSIFSKRPATKRVIDYLRGGMGKDHVEELDKNLVKEVVKLSIPIQKIYEPRRDTFRVTHGDPIFKNIICINKEKNKYGFIDAEPTLGDPILDLAALLATPNIKLSPSDWYLLTEAFLINDKRELEESGIDLNSVRSGLANKLEDWGVEFADDERPGNNYFYTLMGLFHRSSRIITKVMDLKKKNPESYERMLVEDEGLKTTVGDMKRNMSLSLFEVVSTPDRFEISREKYADDLKSLYEILVNEGMIDSPEKYLKDKDRGDSQKVPKKPITPFERRDFDIRRPTHNTTKRIIKRATEEKLKTND